MSVEDDNSIKSILNTSRMPLIKHYYEKNRNITVAYTKDKQNNKIAYAAVIFKREHRTENWNKKLHRIEAIERFKKNAIVVNNFPYYECKLEYYNMFNKNIRKCVMKFGTKSKDENNTSVIWC